MATFAYGGDVGVPSYNDIVLFAKRSGITFSVTSTTTGGHATSSYHYTGNAVDLASSAGQMIQLASWLYSYAPFELELIHSGGSGFFVKNGQKVTAAYYGAATVSEHYNHVHIAMTESGIKAAEGQSGSGGSQAASTASVSGLVARSPSVFDSWKAPCPVPMLLGVNLFLAMVWSVLWIVH